MTTWVAVALGLLLLFFGRKLFWLSSAYLASWPERRSPRAWLKGNLS